jgi:hypothetical protein
MNYKLFNKKLMSIIFRLSPRKDEDATTYKVTGTGPIDCAAHFALLGESLSIIGERLMDVDVYKPKLMHLRFQ